MLNVAAARARRFMTSLQTLSDESLQLIHDEVRDLVSAYPAQPLAEILVIWSLVKTQYSACWSDRSGQLTLVSFIF
jgi:hypothetical protein